MKAWQWQTVAACMSLALRAFAGLDLCDAPRTSFVCKYARRAIMRDMAADIVSRIPRA